MRAGWLLLLVLTGSNPYVPVIEKLYASLEYEEALREISKADAWGANTPEEKVWLALMEGVLSHEVGDTERGMAAFSRGLALAPEAALPVSVSPKVREAFEAARGRNVAAAPPPATARTSPIQPPVPARTDAAAPVPPPPVPSAGGVWFSASARGLAEVVSPALGIAVDLGLATRAFEVRAFALLGERPAYGLELAVVARGARLEGLAGLKGVGVPAAGAVGGGVVFGGRWRLSRHLLLAADASGLGFSASPSYRRFAALASFGALVEFGGP